MGIKRDEVAMDETLENTILGRRKSFYNMFFILILNFEFTQ
jgi:hypothetical protein